MNVRKKIALMNCFTYVCFSLVLSSTSLNSNAVSFTEHKSSVPGISLWSLDNSVTSVNEAFINEERNIFKSHCRESQKIYIYELNSQSFGCQSKDYGVQAGDRFSTFGIEILNADRKAVGVGNIYTVSLNKIEHKNWDVHMLMPNDINKIYGIIKTSSRKIVHDRHFKYVSIIGKELEFSREINLDKFKIMIVPTETIKDSDGSLGGIWSTIIMQKRTGFTVLGHIYGCFNRFGADIDGDGIPGLIVDNSCENSDAAHFSYYRLYPKVELLMEYQAN